MLQSPAAAAGSAAGAGPTPSLWWPFLLSCVSGLSTALGAVLVLLRARLSSAPLSASHLSFTSGLACSVMLAVSLGQMLLPAALTSPHCLGPLPALSICAASAALCVLGLKQAPIDRLLSLVGLSSAALLQPGAPPSSPPLSPLPIPSRTFGSGSGASTPISRPSSPSRHSAAGSGTAQEQLSSTVPPFLAAHDEDSEESGDRRDGGASRDEVRLIIPGSLSRSSTQSSSASNAVSGSSGPYSYSGSAKPALFRSSASLLSSSPSSASTLRLGLLSAVLLALHNLPEGLAVFVSSFDDQRAGLAMALSLAAHNIPEGLIIAVPIYASTRSVWLTVWWPLASGLTEPLGALLALTVLRPYLSHRLMQQLLCAVAGVMLTMVGAELLPAGRAYKQPRAMQAGMAAGLLLIAATSAFSALVW